MKREDKAAVLNSLIEEFKNCDNLFVADYRGLDMPAVTDLRNQLREADAEMRVVKNTLARIAAREAGFDQLPEILVGPTAITFVRGEAPAVAKVLDKIAREGKVIKLRGGLIDGNVVTESQVADIAKLPTREVILSMFVGAVNAPLVQVAGLINAPMRDIVNVLDAAIKKREEAGESAA